MSEAGIRIGPEIVFENPSLNTPLRNIDPNWPFAICSESPVFRQPDKILGPNSPQSPQIANSTKHALAGFYLCVLRGRKWDSHGHQTGAPRVGNGAKRQKIGIQLWAEGCLLRNVGKYALSRNTKG